MKDDFREHESDHPFRSERVFNVNGEWFFQTREQRDMGPYESRESAKEAAKRFANLHDKAKKQTHPPQSESDPGD